MIMKKQLLVRLTTKKNRLTSVFLKIFLVMSFATPIPNIAATFNWTNEAGIPIVSDANIKKLAGTKAIITASNLPYNIISFSVFFTIIWTKIELPIPKLGATIKVDNIIIKLKFSFPEIFNSFAVIEAIGPAAFATLFDPIETSTYRDINIKKPFHTGFIFSFWTHCKVSPFHLMGR